MPAIAALSIKDGLATPVARTFSPSAQTGTRVEFSERSASIASGFKILSHELRKPVGKDGAHRFIIGLYLPTVAVVGGVDAVVRSSSAKVELNVSQNSTLQERRDLLAFVANALDLTSFMASVDNIEPFF